MNEPTLLDTIPNQNLIDDFNFTNPMWDRSSYLQTVFRQRFSHWQYASRIHPIDPDVDLLISSQKYPLESSIFTKKIDSVETFDKSDINKIIPPELIKVEEIIVTMPPKNSTEVDIEIDEVKKAQPIIVIE
jgi:hypothetical protein